jgi:curli production assembly/transport component CsgE
MSKIFVITIILGALNTSGFCQALGKIATSNISAVSDNKPNMNQQQKSKRTIVVDSLFFELEIDQLIINETLSKAGNDFHDLVYSKWVWPAGIKGSFIIVISERPVFGNTTLIEIKLNDIKVFENFTQSRYDVLDELSNSAVELLAQTIINYAEIIRQLEGDDLSGTGIF